MALEDIIAARSVGRLALQIIESDDIPTTDRPTLQRRDRVAEASRHVVVRLDYFETKDDYEHVQAVVDRINARC
jgi:hypothetical protein